MAEDPLRNAKDPLHKAGPEAGKELFRQFSKAADGFPPDAAVDAAMNLLINALRQQHRTRARAEKAFDEVSARTKGVLLDRHYDGLGHRRNVFPFTQVIEMPLIDLRQKH